MPQYWAISVRLRCESSIELKDKAMIARRVHRRPEVRDGGYTAAGTIDIEALLQRCTPGRLSCLANRGVTTVPRLGSLLVHT